MSRTQSSNPDPTEWEEESEAYRISTSLNAAWNNHDTLKRDLQKLQVHHQKLREAHGFTSQSATLINLAEKRWKKTEAYLKNRIIQAHRKLRKEGKRWNLWRIDQLKLDALADVDESIVLSSAASEDGISSEDEHIEEEALLQSPSSSSLSPLKRKLQYDDDPITTQFVQRRRGLTVADRTTTIAITPFGNVKKPTHLPSAVGTPSQAGSSSLEYKSMSTGDLDKVVKRFSAELEKENLSLQVRSSSADKALFHIGLSNKIRELTIPYAAEEAIRICRYIFQYFTPAALWNGFLLRVSEVRLFKF